MCGKSRIENKHLRNPFVSLCSVFRFVYIKGHKRPVEIRKMYHSIEIVVDTTVNCHGWIRSEAAIAAEHLVRVYTTNCKRIIVGMGILPKLLWKCPGMSKEVEGVVENHC